MNFSERYLIYALKAWENDLLREKENLAESMKTETSEVQYLVLSNDMFHVNMALHRLNCILIDAYQIVDD